MTGPLPYWHIIGEDGPYMVIGVELPDLTEAALSVPGAVFGTPAMDAMIRASVQRWKSTRDISRTPGE